MPRAKRFILVGLDGLQLPMVKRFVAEGCLPNFQKLLETGSCGEVLPCWPAWTPTNWGTMATGAEPGTTCLGGWFRRAYDDLEGENDFSTFDSRACGAETIWEAAERQGVRSLAIFHPITWPPRVNDSMVAAPLYQGPGIQPMQISHGVIWASQEGPGPRGPMELVKDGDRWRADVELSIELVAAGADFIDAAHVLPGAEVQTSEVTVPLRFCFDPRAKSATIEQPDGTLVASAKLGEWSDWTYLPFGQRGEGSLRFHLVRCNPADGDVVLLQSAPYPRSGWAHPESIEQPLLDAVGPFLQSSTAVTGEDPALTDLFFDEQAYHGLWMPRAARLLLDRAGWQLYYQHYHILDAVSHRHLAQADPAHPDYDPDAGAWHEEMFRRAHQVCDDILGEFMDMADDDTVVMAISDHGNVPNFFQCDYLARLEETGLLVRDNGRIVWEKTKAYMLPMRIFDIFINLKGRSPRGAVDPADYETVQEEIIDALLDWRNPRDGKRVVAFAVKKKDAPIFGYYGPEAGDVMFVFNSGYGRGGVPDGSVAPARQGANHGPQILTTRTEFASNLAAAICAGPGIRPGYERDADANGFWQLTGIVSTICHLLGIRPPRDAVGGVMRDMLED
ncbi:MAG: alkaline phosphatase family protein [Armatimonadota bacterium]